MFCSNCGNKIEENSAFCNECGMPLNDTSSQRQQNQYVSVNTKKMPKTPFVLMIIATSIILIMLFLIIGYLDSTTLTFYNQYGVNTDTVQISNSLLICTGISILVMGILVCAYYYRPQKTELCLKFLMVIFILAAVTAVITFIWVIAGINMTNELSSIVGVENEQNLLNSLLVGAFYLFILFVPYVISYIMIRKRRKSQK